MKETRASNVLDNLAEWHDIESWPELLDDFIFKAQKGLDYKNPKTEQAIALLLATMMQDAKFGYSWNEYKKPLGLRKISGELNPVDDWDTHVQAYAVVMDYMAHFIDEDEAIIRIQRIAPIKERRAQDFIKKHRNEIYEKLKDSSSLNGRKIEKLRPPT